MKVLIYSHAFAPTTGGVQTYAVLLASGLARAGHDPEVVTATPAGGTDDTQFSFPIVRRPSLLQLWRAVGRADVVQLAGPALLPLCVALLRRKPVVIEHHGYQAICPNGLLLHQPDRTACPGHFMAGDYPKCLRCVAAESGWLAGSRQLLLTFVRRGLCRLAANAPITYHVLHRLQLPHSQVIYYGIPDPLPPGRSSAAAPAGRLCFAYVGRLVAEKGLPLLIEAADRLRRHGQDFCLKFIGDGPERPALERLVAERGLCAHVTFTGFLKGMELWQAMEGVAAVVMPSIWEETAGLAAIEQMMRGRLVIASDIGGLGEVVDGTGLKFAPGSADQLTECMRRVIESPRLVSEIGERARRRTLELFHDSRMIGDHTALYEQLVA